MKHIQTFEKLVDRDIFIDSDPIDHHDAHHKTIDDAYAGYEVALKNFSYCNVTVEQAKGDVSGDDFKGCDADLEILLSNKIFITYSHNFQGKGSFVAKTSKGTELLSQELDLVEQANGYAPVLIALINKVLKFDF